MKKLMFAMSVAAMAALCAQAAIPTGYTSGIDFENTTTGYLNVQLDDTNTQNGTDLKFWASAAASTEQGTTGQVESQIVDGSQIEGSTNTGKFLKVDETLPLQRSMAGVDANGIPTPTAVGDGIEISSSVQFTAADEAPTPSDGDKLLVWMQAAAEAEGTEGDADYKPAKKAGVMVTDKNNRVTMIKEIADNDVEAFTAAWHTLVIKAVAEGSGLTKTSSFTVTLDGKTSGPFASRVTGGDTAQTISSIGFQGTGAVDDIGFKSLALVETEKFTYTVNISDAMAELLTSATVQYDDADPVEWDGKAKELVVGTAKKVTIVITPSEGYKVANATAVKGENGSYTIEVDVSAAKANENLSIDIEVVADQGGTAKPEIVTGDGQTVEAAVAAANSETGIVVKNCTAADVTINGTSITVGTTTVTIPAYYTANFDATASKITLTLNENALEEETAVSVGADNLGLTISNSKAKLYYGLATSTTVDAGQYTAPTTLVQGTGNALTLTAEKNGNACFYKLYVTDIAPTAVK